MLALSRTINTETISSLCFPVAKPGSIAMCLVVNYPEVNTQWISSICITAQRDSPGMDSGLGWTSVVVFDR